MSGICGIVRFDGQEVLPESVRRMAAAAGYRGPDGTRVWADGAAALARQQSDPSRGRPRRPDHLEHAGLVVVADARIDNRSELLPSLRRAQALPRDGMPGDAELIAASYTQWGEACAERLIGDFAFAVWDTRRRRLLLARDPMAMRGLYYHLEPRRRIVFATEAQQVLAAPDVPIRPFEPAVATELAGDMGRPEWSFYEGVEQLPPAWALSCDTEGQRRRRYWDIDPERRLKYRRREDYVEHLRHLLIEAVDARVRGGGAPGILLSGGLDSASVASIMGWLREQRDPDIPRLHSFSWAFEHLTECDERHISRHIVDRYGLAATDVPADASGPLADYPAHAPHRDDPMLGGFQPLIEHALGAARDRGVAVMLGGDRGDLVLGPLGLSYTGMARDRQWRSLAGEVLQHRRLLGDSPVHVAQRAVGLTLSQRLGDTPVRTLFHGLAGRARGAPRAAGTGPVPAWVRGDLAARVDLEDLLAGGLVGPGSLDVPREWRYRYVFTQLHVRGMAWSERRYAEYGLGFADPYSDRRLVEFVLAAPQCVIGRPWEFEKPLLRSAVRGVMPEPARRQARKISPRPLFERGLRARAEVVRHLLSDPQVEQRGWADAATLRSHYEGWLAGNPLAPAFWHTLAVEFWLSTHWPDASAA